MFTVAKVLLKVIITVQLFNWTLAEVDTLMPGTEEYARTQLEQIKIPSFDEIVELISEDGEISFTHLGTKLDTFLNDNLGESRTASLKDSLPENFGENVEDLKQLIINEFQIAEAQAESWEEVS